MKIADKNQEMMPKPAGKGEGAKQPATATGTADSGASAVRPSGDRLELSTTLKRTTRMADTLKALPDVRKGRVEELKRQIDAGEYRVDSKDVAEKMIAAFRKGPKS